jgi:release factor glutamine methyltransferase
VTAAEAVDLRSLVRQVADALSEAGVPSPRFDAEALAAHVMGVEPRDLVKHQTLTRSQAVELSRLGALRGQRVPLQHLTGHAYFRRLALLVGPGVFIPRPETEVVVEAALAEVARLIAEGIRAPRVIDLCAGSGAIAASVATEAPASVVHAVELSPEAHAWAERNLHGLGVDLRLGDAATAFPELDGQVDVVIANPPYIPPDGIIRDREVLEHDPPVALWGGGPDGLDVPRLVTARAATLLRPGGLFVMEHADVQRHDVLAMLAATGDWVDAADHQDLAGRDRYVTARRGKMLA